MAEREMGKAKGRVDNLVPDYPDGRFTFPQNHLV
jgi:hypothetical protein